MANRLKKIKGYLPLPVPSPELYIQEIGRGTGAIKPKKGRGSFVRKAKHKGGDY